MQMIDWKAYEIFADNISTLKEISKDDSQKEDIQYMTDSLKEAVDFDAVKEKIRDSLLLFCDITGMQISDTREWMEFILVYNISKNPMPNQLEREGVQESNSRDVIAKYISKKAKEEFVRFDLKRFKTLYFKEVHTYSKEEFEEYLVRCAE